jgi:hypothetical protein
MKQRSEKKVYQKRIPPADLILPDDRRSKTLFSERASRVQDFPTLAEQVTKSRVFHKNWYVEELRERFKHFDRMKRIDKVFPYARLSDSEETCMVLIDEPKTEIELDQCLQKVKVMAELGYKYAIIECDSSLYDVLNQLGAV